MEDVPKYLNVQILNGIWQTMLSYDLAGDSIAWTLTVTQSPGGRRAALIVIPVI